jgi:hypothetical protein
MMKLFFFLTTILSFSLSSSWAAGPLCYTINDKRVLKRDKNCDCRKDNTCFKLDRPIKYDDNNNLSIRNKKSFRLRKIQEESETAFIDDLGKARKVNRFNAGLKALDEKIRNFMGEMNSQDETISKHSPRKTEEYLLRKFSFRRITNTIMKKASGLIRLSSSKRKIPSYKKTPSSQDEFSSQSYDKSDESIPEIAKEDLSAILRTIQSDPQKFEVHESDTLFQIISKAYYRSAYKSLFPEGEE